MKKLLIAITIASILLLSGCATKENENTIKFGLQATPESSIVQVALEKGYFEEHGISVELEEFTAGKFALQAFLAGDLDYAVVGDVPVALAKMQGNDFYVLGEIAVCPDENPVLVKGEGIDDPAEYFSKQKRRISTSIGGTPEFYTYNFLKYYGIDESQVEIIAQKPEEMVGTLASGSVDGISIFEPYPTIAENALQGKTTRFLMPEGIYAPRYVVVVNKKLADEKPEKVLKLAKALLEAEAFVRANPLESQEIVAETTGFDEEVIANIWGECEMKITAPQELIDVWESEAEWAIETGKIDEMPIPDFGLIVREDILKEARGEA